MMSVCFLIEELRGFSGGLSNVNTVFKNPAYGGFLGEVRLGRQANSL